ncbi:MAG: VWA domain-containing protein [Acidobacteriota bacterium]
MNRTGLPVVAALISFALPVLAQNAPDASTAAYLEIIFDASGSMEKMTERAYSEGVKVAIARDEMKRFFERLPHDPSFHVALRTFGSTTGSGCDGVRLLRPFGPIDDQLSATIDGISPAPFGKTPIASSLAQALADFTPLKDKPGKKSIMLVTDGVETCGGDVDAAIAKIFQTGIELKVHIVGFDVLDYQAPEQKKLREAAAATGGEALYPKNREELERDLKTIAEKEAPPAPAAPPPDEGLLAKLKENIVLVAIGALVILLALAYVLLRRDSGEAEEEDEELEA